MGLAISDYHVHTSASHCCKERYGVEDAWNAARDRGVEHIGITDHDVPFKNGFLKAQRETTKRLDGVLQGLEVSIRDARGKIQVSKHALAMLDFVLIAEHVHIMPAWTLFRKGHRQFEAWWNDPQERYLVEKYYDKHATMTWNALDRNRVDILAHPWRFPWHKGILDVATIGISEKVIRKAVERGVHVEFSRAVMNILQQDLAPKDGKDFGIPALRPWKGRYGHELVRPVPFFRQYFGMCQDLGAMFTLGSDAHKLDGIGVFPGIESLLDAVDIKRKNIVHVLKAA
nr:PHP domain-containing protein [Candidatus Sigynarchaeota archaeon]